MRLGPLALLALIAVILVAPSQTYAQTPAPPVHTARGVGVSIGEPARATARPDDVVARLMSFDRNNDGKVQKAELAERMYAVMDRGDANGDGCLDRSELLALATAKPEEAAVRGFGHGRYMIGAETDVSSRRHLEGALDDLRIDAARREPALAIVRTFNDTREADAEAELLDAMHSILSEEQVRIVTAALEQQRRSGLQKVVSSPDQRVTLIQSQLILVGLGNIERRVASFNLSPEVNGRATAALKHYRGRLRPNEAERAELGRQLASVLTSEESENFLAAIARQPVVAAGGFRVAAQVGPEGGPQRTITFVTQ
jgi:hypothetical protein